MPDLAVVELRRYRLHPGVRDGFVALFERALVESQEACGMHLLGQFRDLEDPDRFVWLRGFHDMAARRSALERFYGGPVWAANADEANAAMVDFDDVRLLRPLRPGSGVAGLDPSRRAPVGAPKAPARVVVALVHHLDDPADAAPRFDAVVVPALTAAGATPLAAFRSEHAPNTFPRLPVRAGEELLVAVAALPPGRDRAPDTGADEVLRLDPTPRSLIR